MSKQTLPKKTFDIEADVRAWFLGYTEEAIRPYLEKLLAITQAKLTRHSIAFFDGQNSHWFEINGDWRSNSSVELGDAIDGAVISKYFHSGNPQQLTRQEALYARHFPELIEFIRTIYEADDHLRAAFGGVVPAKEQPCPKKQKSRRSSK